MIPTPSRILSALAIGSSASLLSAAAVGEHLPGAIYWHTPDLPCKGNWGPPIVSSYYKKCVSGNYELSICRTMFDKMSGPYAADKPVTIVGYQISFITTDKDASSFFVLGSAHGGGAL